MAALGKLPRGVGMRRVLVSIAAALALVAPMNARAATATNSIAAEAGCASESCVLFGQAVDAAATGVSFAYFDIQWNGLCGTAQCSDFYANTPITVAVTRVGSAATLVSAQSGEFFRVSPCDPIMTPVSVTIYFHVSFTNGDNVNTSMDYPDPGNSRCP